MKLSKIVFRKFKSIVSGQLRLDPDITIIVGENESGKSNVLFGIEALSKDVLLSPDMTTNWDEDYRRRRGPYLEFHFKLSSEERKTFSATNKLLDSTSIVLEKEGVEQTGTIPPTLFDQYTFIKPNFRTCEITLRSATTIFKTINPTLEVSKDSFISLGDFPPDVLKTIKEDEEIMEIMKDEKILLKDIPEHWLSVVEYTKLLEVFIASFPNAVRFNRTGNIPDDISIEDLHAAATKVPGTQTFKNLLKLADVNLTKNEWLGDSKTDAAAKPYLDTERRDQILRYASEILTKKIREVWKTDEQMEFLLSCDASVIKLRLKDQTNGTYKPSVRSDGFRWYLDFYVNLLAEKKDLANHKILVMEEPGVYLHPEAQEDLLKKVLLESCGDLLQIVFTTHSPFMLDEDRLGSIRVVEKGKKDKGSSVMTVGGGIKGKGFRLLTKKFKFMVGEGHGLEKLSLVVEGPSDHRLISAAFKKIVKNSSERPKIWPAGGASEVPAFAKVLASLTPKSVALLDADEDGLKALKELKKADPNLKIISTTVKEIVDSHQRDMETIEDLIPQEIYLEALNAVYEGVSFNRDGLQFSPIVLADLPKPTESESRGILSRIESVFVGRKYMDKDGFDDSYDKAGIIEEVAKKVDHLQQFDGWERLKQAVEKLNSFYKTTN